MKVVLVVDSFAPAWGYGGPPRLVATLANQLAKMGHEIVVLTTDVLDIHRFSSLRSESYRVIRVKNLSNQLAWRRKVFIPIPRMDVLSGFRDADVVHLFQTRSLLNVVGYIGARFRKAPLVFSPLGSLPRVGGLDKIPKRLYDAVFLRKMAGQVGAALGQTKHEMQVCENWGVEQTKVHLVPLCVNLDEYASLPRGGSFVSKFAELRGIEQTYLFIGRIHRFKGVEMLMRAFSKAFPRSKHMLVIAGKDEGGYLGHLKALASALSILDRVLFLGPIYGHDKLEALVDSHAFAITPSIYEETSLAALEAAACQTPIVTTAQAEIPWLEEYSAGFCVNYNLDSIAEGLVRMSDVMGEDRRRMGSRSRKLVEDHFSPLRVALQLEDIYRSLHAG